MSDIQKDGSVVTHDGRVITLKDLPPTNTTRWISRRKADLVAALQGGIITRETILQQYAISAEELDEWLRMFSRYGTAGLRATRLRHYRMREQFSESGTEGEGEENISLPKNTRKKMN